MFRSHFFLTTAICLLLSPGGSSARESIVFPRPLFQYVDVASDDGANDYLHMSSVESQIPIMRAEVAYSQQVPVTPRTLLNDALKTLSDHPFSNKSAPVVAKKRKPPALHPGLLSTAEEVASNSSQNYCIVKKGASTSKIARDVCAGPLYIEKGCLSKFLALNPIVENPDLIFPGQKLILPSGEKRSTSCVNGMEETRLPAQAAEETPTPPQITSGTVTQGPTVALGPTPVTTPAWKPHSEFGLGLETSFTRIDSVDAVTQAQATLLSNLDFGANGHWLQQWTQTVSTEILFNLTNMSFMSVSNRAINDPSLTIYGLGLGTHENLSDSFKLGEYLQIQQQVFLRATSTTAINLDQVAVPELDAEGIYTIAKVNPFKFDLLGRGSYYFPSTTGFYSVQPGWGYLVKGQLTQEFEKIKIQGGVGWQMQYQNTSIATQKETGLLLI